LPEYRTLSIQVDETVTHGAKKGKGDGNVKTVAELDWHLVPADDVIRRLRTSQTTGLDEEQVERRLKENGKNMLSAPPSNLLKK
jgi:sodium/potassium-transporting ATPase subunit alpha